LRHESTKDDHVFRLMIPRPLGRGGSFFINFYVDKFTYWKIMLLFSSFLDKY